MTGKDNLEDNGGPFVAAVTSGQVTSYVRLEPTQGSPENASKFMQSDAAPGLDQSITPQWSAPHTFLSNINFGASRTASFSLDGASSLKYEVTSAEGMHEFYVGGALAGQIDSPSDPQGDNSLVNKRYVDSLVGDGQPSDLGKYIAFSSVNYGSTGQAAAGSNDSMVVGMSSTVSGSYSAVLGKEAAVSGDESVALGYQTNCSAFQSVALGSYSGDNGQANVVSIGWSAVGSPAVQRRIINIADGQASNEAATFGQLQSYTSPRLSTYFDSSFLDLPDGVEGDLINALERWPIMSSGILKSGTDTTSIAKLVKHAPTNPLAFYIYLNNTKIGSVTFDAGQQVGSIAFDENTESGDGSWTLQIGDLVSLTNPHPAVSAGEQAQGLMLVIVSSVAWKCTPSNN